MHRSPVFGHPAEPSPRDVLMRARKERQVALKSARELLEGAEHRPGDHDLWRFNIDRHGEAIAAFDAAIAGLPA
jgi:hypothetical protein